MTSVILVAAWMASSGVQAPPEAGKGNKSVRAASTKAPVSAQLQALKKEPNVRDVQKATLAYFGLDDDRVDGLRSRAAWKHLLPEASVSGGAVSSRADDETTNNEYSQTEIWVVRGVDGKAQTIDGTLSWSLPNLVFNSEVLSVAGLGEKRQKLIEDITKLYYDRRTAQVEMIFDPPPEQSDRITKQLKIEKYTSLLDAMTGGWFMKQLQK